MQKPLITVIWEAVPGSPPVPFHTFRKTVLQDLTPPTCHLSGFILNKHSLPITRLGRRFLAVHLCCCCCTDMAIASRQLLISAASLGTSLASASCAWRLTMHRPQELPRSVSPPVSRPDSHWASNWGWRQEYKWGEKRTRQICGGQADC